LGYYGKHGIYFPIFSDLVQGGEIVEKWIRTIHPFQAISEIIVKKEQELF